MSSDYSDPQVSEEKFRRLREEMVATQILGPGREIKSPQVIAAMRKVPRHEFVPQSLQEYAYEDHPLAIGAGQTISQPYIVAFMTEILQLSQKDRVLEIGAGSGYQSAVLAEVAGWVYTVEVIAALAQESSAILARMGYANIQMKVGDGYNGWIEQAPFDAIIVTCAPDHIPRPLLQQLKLGGRMIIPVGNRNIGQKLVYLKKTDVDTLSRWEVLPVMFVPMTGQAEKQC